MSLRKRLEELEGNVASQEQPGGTPRYLEAYFRALENWRRVEAGLDLLPYTQEDREDDEEFLNKTLPIYRQNPGWQSTEAQETLDAWEHSTRERLQANDTERTVERR